MARRIVNKRERKIKYAIIGEGITEWHYFNGMKRFECLNYDIKPELPKHSNLDSIKNKALELKKKGYDKVFCVIDFDVIIDDSRKLQKIIKYQKQYKAIIWLETMPCIEYWFLLHFLSTYSSRIYLNFKEVKVELIKHIKNYDKSNDFFKKNSLYEILSSNGKKDIALCNGRKSLIEKRKSDNPYYSYTKMQEIFKELNAI